MRREQAFKLHLFTFVYGAFNSLPHTAKSSTNGYGIFFEGNTHASGRVIRNMMEPVREVRFLDVRKQIIENRLRIMDQD